MSSFNVTHQQSTSVSFLGSIQTSVPAGQKNTITNIASSYSRSVFDSFQSSSSDAIIKRTVEKMQLAINSPVMFNRQRQDTAQSFTLSGVDENVDLKIIRMTLGEYDESHFSTLESFNVSNRESLQGMRFDGQLLRNVDTQTLEVVNLNAASASASVSASVSTNGGAPADGGLDFSSQTEINLRQAKQVSDQLNLGATDWGFESLARDLAVFGLDLTAMNEAPEKLVETVRQRSLDLLDKVAKQGGTTQQRNQITGASARLVNGLKSSAGAFISASASVSSSNVSARVDGVSINASAAIAVGNVIVDPLVLDLKGDGIDLKSAEEGVKFDMNGDGAQTQMGFIRGDDALLFVDEYGDGVVHDGRQLFGNTDGHANGFEKLRSYDDNGDGVIDENDAIWNSLRVWVEKTEDGVCESGETMSLSEAGIKSINVSYDNVREDDGKGNLIGQTGSFTRTDGTSGLAADAWLQELR